MRPRPSRGSRADDIADTCRLPLREPRCGSDTSMRHRVVREPASSCRSGTSRGATRPRRDDERRSAILEGAKAQQAVHRVARREQRRRAVRIRRVSAGAFVDDRHRDRVYQTAMDTLVRQSDERAAILGTAARAGQRESRPAPATAALLRDRYGHFWVFGSHVPPPPSPLPSHEKSDNTSLPGRLVLAPVNVPLAVQ